MVEGIVLKNINKGINMTYTPTIDDEETEISIADFNLKFGKSFHGYPKHKLVSEDDIEKLVRCRSKVEWGAFFEIWDEWGSKEEYAKYSLPIQEFYSKLYKIIA